ncbi:MAG TPA: hypothetical protein VHX40_09225 [Acidimicrobiales bacterium]|jgi:hypothetical protein|nr:hypothetical protein [Acidimicrobiales bacterium]
MDTGPTDIGAGDTGEGDLDLDLLASSLQADGNDVRLLLKVLVSRLAGALGGRLEVERTGGRLFKRADEIRRVSVRLGDDTLDATVERGSLVCTIARSSGGIRIRSTKVTVDEWLRKLLTTLRDEAAGSQSTRLALEAMVIGNRTAGELTSAETTETTGTSEAPGPGEAVGTGGDALGTGNEKMRDGGGA